MQVLEGGGGAVFAAGEVSYNLLLMCLGRVSVVGDGYGWKKRAGDNWIFDVM